MNTRNFEIYKNNSLEEATATAGELLNQALLDHAKKPILLMVSGGSALSTLDYVGNKTLGENLTVSVTDDRFAETAEANNFLQLQKTEFYTVALEAEVSFFGTLPRANETPAELAKRWEYNLRTWHQEHPDGVTIALLGMGADGHTAGIFPYPEDPQKFKKLFSSEDWVIAYDAVGKHKFSQRITTTLTFFKMIDEAIIFACGTDKKIKLNEVLQKTSEFNALPAAAWDEIKNVKIVSDVL